MEMLEQGLKSQFSSEEVIEDVLAQGFKALPFKSWVFPDYWPRDSVRFRASWASLIEDRQMGDGGHYRYRRFFKALWRPERGLLEPMDDNSIYQELEDNSLNGGRVRYYEPIEPEIQNMQVFRDLILADWSLVKSFYPESAELVVCVHQVRIIARPGEAALPTPEGIHRDAEDFTFQHFLGRESVEGGVFRVFKSKSLEEEIYQWQQEDVWDAVVFTGSTWHDATPLHLEKGEVLGFRDILLVDFTLFKEDGNQPN